MINADVAAGGPGTARPTTRSASYPLLIAEVERKGRQPTEALAQVGGGPGTARPTTRSANYPLLIAEVECKGRQPTEALA